MHRLRLVALSAVLIFGALSVLSSQGIFPTGAGVLPYEPDLRFGMAFTGKLCRATHGDGGLIVAALEKGAPCQFMPDPSRNLSTSYRIEAAQRLRQGPQGEHFGIFFGDHADTNRVSYLTVTMTNSGVVALEYLDAGSKWNRIPAVSPAPKPRVTPGAINRVAVEVRDKEVRAFINGELFASGVSPVPVDGRVGVYVDEVGQEVVFSEFRISSLSPPTTTTIVNKPAGSDIRVTPGGKLFLEDDLTAQQTFAPIQDEFCSTAYADGGLRITGRGDNGCEWYPGNLTEAPMRARFELSTRTLKGDTTGMVLGYSSRADKLHYHFLTSMTGQFALEISQNGSSKPLIPWTASPTVRTTQGATNRLAVEVDNQELRTFINGQFVGRAVSPEVVQGGYGFLVIASGSVAVFSNLRITDLTGSQTTTKEGGAGRALATGGKRSGAGRPEPTGGESRGRPKP
jgi:hypothetical protein